MLVLLRGRVDASPGVPAPYVVLDLGRGLAPYQAWCWCRWRSGWRLNVAAARAEHDRHVAAAHGRGRRAAPRWRVALVAAVLVAAVLVLGVLAGLLLQAPPRWLAAPPPPALSEVADVWAVTCSTSPAPVGGGERR